MTILSIDPGARGCGCAIFTNSKLVAAAYVKNPKKVGSSPAECLTMARAVYEWYPQTIDAPMMIVLETPVTYGGRAARGDANDLFPLAMINGALTVLFSDAQIASYTPHGWKGSVDPDAMIERIKSRLSPEEWPRVELPSAKSLQHNVWDSVGIGLAHLGRLERKKVYARE